MAKPGVVTELWNWMVEKGLSDKDLAERLTERLKDKELSISARQVFRWRKGLSYPRPVYALELAAISDGRLNPLTMAKEIVKKEGLNKPAADEGPPDEPPDTE